jgi:hypothetical protein
MLPRRIVLLHSLLFLRLLLVVLGAIAAANRLLKVLRRKSRPFRAPATLIKRGPLAEV